MHDPKMLLVIEEERQAAILENACLRAALEWIETKARLAHNVNHVEVYSVCRGIADEARAALQQISPPTVGGMEE